MIFAYSKCQGSLINRTSTTDELGDAKTMLAQIHGHSMMKALLNGFAGIAPRSATQNLIELLSILVTKFPAESKVWMTEILYAVCLILIVQVQYFCLSMFTSGRLRPI